MNIPNGIPLSVERGANLRNHIPSQAERTRSLQLIQQWKIHIESVKLSIQEAEESFRTSQMALRRTYQSRRAAIREEFEVNKERLTKQNRAYTEPLRLSLAAIEGSMLLEAAFVASIRRIPDEILVEIFEWCLDGGLPTRKLALVCKAWKALLLNTSSFWGNLKAFFVTAQRVRYYARTLQRRIELSRSALLDVTLSTLGYDTETNQIDLFTLIAKSKVDRWRSLKVVQNPAREYLFPKVEFVPQGKFSSLRNIEFDALAENDPFLPFYTILQNSNPPIREVICLKGVPKPLRGSSVFQHTSKIVTREQFIGYFPPLDNLQEMKIQDPITQEQLSSLQGNKLVHLELHSIRYFRSDFALEFPELLSLSITNDRLSCVINLSAPKLAKLELGKGYSNSDPKKKWYYPNVQNVRDDLPLITFKPTTLYINIGISTKGLLVLMKDWSQLMHLSLAFGEEFLWNGTFPRSLSRKGNLLCPKLVTLCLESRSPDFDENMKRWEASAMAILAARKNMPLRSIEWRHDDGPWHRLTSNDTI